MRIRQSFWSSLLHSEIKQIIPSRLRLRAPGYVLAAAIQLLWLSAASTAFAGSATWNLNPGGGPDCPGFPTSACWGDAANWTPATVPNGPGDTATFDVSNATAVLVGDQFATPFEVNGIVFSADASAFTINVATFADFDEFLTISGVGITNNSGIVQNFVAGEFETEAAVIQFTNSATAGHLTVFTNINYGLANHTDFFDTSSAGSATFINDGGPVGLTLGSFTSFFDSAMADNAVLIANGGSPGWAFSGGKTIFNATSDAGNATLIANPSSNGGPGGSIEFFADSTGSHSRVEIFGNGNLDISAHNAPGVTIGSLEGGRFGFARS